MSEFEGGQLRCTLLSLPFFSSPTHHLHKSRQTTSLQYLTSGRQIMRVEGIIQRRYGEIQVILLKKVYYIQRVQVAEQQNKSIIFFLQVVHRGKEIHIPSKQYRTKKSDPRWLNNRLKYTIGKKKGIYRRIKREFQLYFNVIYTVKVYIYENSYCLLYSI